MPILLIAPPAGLFFLLALAALAGWLTHSAAVAFGIAVVLPFAGQAFRLHRRGLALWRCAVIVAVPSLFGILIAGQIG